MPSASAHIYLKKENKAKRILGKLYVKLNVFSYLVTKKLNYSSEGEKRAPIIDQNL